jgi:hypothetical protein
MPLAGSTRPTGERVAVMLTLIRQAQHVDPQSWLADVLARIHDTTSTVLIGCCPGIGNVSLPDWQHESCQAERGV